MIKYRSDVFQGEDRHPQCVFFDQFPSSPDPEEIFHGALFCQMDDTETSAEQCKGDYLRCPLAYGRSTITKNENGQDDKLPF